MTGAAILSLSVFIFNATFSVAHWIFAFKYYKVQMVMPYIRRIKEVPEENVVVFDLLDKTFIAINIVPSLLNATAYFLVNYYIYEEQYARITTA